MDNTRYNTRREGDGSGEKYMPPQVKGQFPPQVQEQVTPQYPNDPPIVNAMFEEFRDSMNLLDQALMSQSNRGEVAVSNSIGGISATGVSKFLRINTSEFYGYKVM